MISLKVTVKYSTDKQKCGHITDKVSEFIGKILKMSTTN